MNVYPLTILSPEKKLFDGKVTALTVTCENGSMTVLADHAPMLALLVEGPIIVQTGRETMEGVAGCGVLQVERKGVAVMIHSFRLAGDEAPEDVPVEDEEMRDPMLL